MKERVVFQNVTGDDIRRVRYAGLPVWAMVTIDGRKSVNLRCPKCGVVGHLQEHRIFPDGSISPSLDCGALCGFDESCVLEDWTGFQ